jgi:hypothetical protein
VERARRARAKCLTLHSFSCFFLHSSCSYNQSVSQSVSHRVLQTEEQRAVSDGATTQSCEPSVRLRLPLARLPVFSALLCAVTNRMLASVLLAFPLRSFLALFRLRLALFLRLTLLLLLAFRMLVVPFLTANRTKKSTRWQRVVRRPAEIGATDEWRGKRGSRCDVRGEGARCTEWRMDLPCIPSHASSCTRRAPAMNHSVNDAHRGTAVDKPRCCQRVRRPQQREQRLWLPHALLSDLLLCCD